jgi:hypothetical protein
MRKHLVLPIALALALLLLVIGGLVLAQGSDPLPAAPEAAPLGTGFTYQGRLDLAGEPVDDECWFVFRLYDDATSGSQVGAPITTTEAISVTAGLFTVTLNEGGEFGSSAFAGNARWLDIRVKCSGDSAYVALGRQELTAAPYALYAVNAGALDGRDASQFARLDRYSIPGIVGGTVTMTIPHYNAFQITIGEAFGNPGGVAWLSGVENDGSIAWIGIKPDGTVVHGTASLNSTDTLITVNADIALKCPGNGNYELVLTSDYEDVRAMVTW